MPQNFGKGGVILLTLQLNTLEEGAHEVYLRPTVLSLTTAIRIPQRTHKPGPLSASPGSPRQGLAHETVDS